MKLFTDEWTRHDRRTRLFGKEVQKTLSDSGSVCCPLVLRKCCVVSSSAKTPRCIRSNSYRRREFSSRFDESYNTAAKSSHLAEKEGVTGTRTKLFGGCSRARFSKEQAYPRLILRFGATRCSSYTTCGSLDRSVHASCANFEKNACFERHY